MNLYRFLASARELNEFSKDEDVMKVFNKVIENVKDKHKAILRDN